MTLLRADAVRERAQRMSALALEGSLEDWMIDLDRLPATADFVARVVRERYPRLDVPVHSRWRHFVFGSRDLWGEIAGDAHWQDADAAARSAFDLAVASVLLDAGAGAQWRYQDRAAGLVAARSEGLALASLRWFERGGLSDNPSEPYRVDAAALRRVDAHAIQGAFQAGDGNRLLGLDGRAALLNRLGAAMQSGRICSPSRTRRGPEACSMCFVHEPRIGGCRRPRFSRSCSRRWVRFGRHGPPWAVCRSA